MTWLESQTEEEETAPTCRRIWILPFNYVHDSVADQLVEGRRNLATGEQSYRLFQNRRLGDIEQRADLEQVTVVVHHEQDHQVHLPFGESPAVDNGTGERPFHRHPVLDLAEKCQCEHG